MNNIKKKKPYKWNYYWLYIKNIYRLLTLFLIFIFMDTSLSVTLVPVSSELQDTINKNLWLTNEVVDAKDNAHSVLSETDKINWIHSNKVKITWPKQVTLWSTDQETLSRNLKNQAKQEKIKLIKQEENTQKDILHKKVGDFLQKIPNHPKNKKQLKSIVNSYMNDSHMINLLDWHLEKLLAVTTKYNCDNLIEASNILELLQIENAVIKNNSSDCPWISKQQIFNAMNANSTYKICKILNKNLGWYFDYTELELQWNIGEIKSSLRSYFSKMEGSVNSGSLYTSWTWNTTRTTISLWDVLNEAMVRTA